MPWEIEYGRPPQNFEVVETEPETEPLLYDANGKMVTKFRSRVAGFSRDDYDFYILEDKDEKQKSFDFDDDRGRNSRGPFLDGVS